MRALVFATVLIVASLMASGAAFAGVTIALCKLGGCECMASPHSAEDIINVAGFEAIGPEPIDPTVSTLVVDFDHNYVYWSDASREQIDRAYSGRGECPIKLFMEEEIVPRDGLWRWNTVATSVQGCPPMLADMMGDPTGLGDSHSARVRWNGRFDPALLAGSADMSTYRWIDNGGGNWATIPIGDSGCEDGICQSISVRLWMSLVSERRVTGHLTYSMRISGSGGQAVLASLGIDSCKVTVRYRIDHVSD